jgi:hypothetical protein
MWLLLNLFLTLNFAGLSIGAAETGLVTIRLSEAPLSAVEAWEEYQEQDDALELKKVFSYGEDKQFDGIANLPKIKEWVAKKNRQDYAMNIHIAFQLLGRIGTLIKISYAGCKGFSCQVASAKVFSEYQDMVEKAFMTSGEFVHSTAKALRYHRWALKKLDKSQTEKALKYLIKASKKANHLEKEAQKMVVLSENLKKLAHVAFIEAVGNDVENKKEIDLFKEKLSNATAYVENIQAMVNENNKLKEQIEAEARKQAGIARKWEKQHEKEAERKVNIQEICTVTPVPVISFGPLSIGKSVKSCYNKVDEADVARQKTALSTFERNLRDARNRELEHLKEKLAIQRKTRDLFGTLASNLEAVDFAKLKGSELEIAKKSLEIAIQTLTIVKTIFLRTVSFWTSVVNSAKARGDTGDTMQDLKDLDMDEREEFEELLIESGMSWIALGKVCADARKSMVSVRKEVTKQFITLPNEEKARLLVQNSKPIIEETRGMINRLGDNIEEEKKMVEEGEQANEVEAQLSKPS